MNEAKKKKITIASIIAGIAVYVFYFGFFTNSALGNPAIIQAPAGCKTAVSTTTENFMTPGTGTTTLVCDLAGGSNEPTIDSSVLAVQFTGSTTQSQLRVAIECSNDNIQFYQKCDSNVATTTDYIFTYASSTSLGGVPAKSLPGQYAGYPINNYAIKVNTPMRYVRAVFSMVATTSNQFNGSVWAQFINQKELR